MVRNRILSRLDQLSRLGMPALLRSVSARPRTRCFHCWLILILIVPLAIGCSREAKKSRHLERADRFFKQKSYREAALEYMNVLQLDVHQPVAIERLGTICFDQGQTHQALALLLKTRESQPNNSVIRLKLARLYLSVGQAAHSREEAMAVLTAEPRNEQALLILSEAFAKPEDVKDTEMRLRQFQKLNGDSAAVQVVRGKLAVVQGDFRRAEEHFLQAQTSDPKSSFAQMALGGLRWLQRDFQKADQHFTAAAELASGDWNPRLKRAELKLAIGDVQQARRITEEIVQSMPQNFPALSLLAKIAFAEKKYDECLALTQRILEQAAADPDSMLLRAQATLAKGEVAEAIKHFEQLRDKYPQVSRFQYHLALAYLKGEQTAKASASLKQAIALEPNFVEAILLSATLAIQARDFSSAVNDLSELLKRAPKTERAYPMLADAYRGQGQLDHALAWCQRWKETFPSSPQAHYVAGFILRQQQKDNEARHAFEAAVGISPDYILAVEQLIDLDLREKNNQAALSRAEQLTVRQPKAAPAFLLLSRVHLALSDSDKAEAALLKALELDPGSTPASMLLAQLYVRSNRRAQAVEKLQALVDKNPADWGALLLLGIIQQELNQYAKARSAYEQVLKLNPKSPAALNNLAYIAIEHLNDTNASLAYAQKARQLAPEDPSIADTLGWAFCHRHEYSLGLSLLGEAAVKMPLNPEVQFHLGTARYMMGEEQEARTAFQRALEINKDFAGKSTAERRLWILDIDPQRASAEDVGKLKNFVSQEPGDVVALLRLAAIAERNGALDQALESYQAAVRSNPKSTVLLLHLARFYAQLLRDPQQGLEQGKLALNLAPRDPAITHVVGQLAYQARDYKRAYNLLQESAKERPADPELLFDLALAAYNNNQVLEAEQVMRRALDANSSFPRSGAARQFLETIALNRDLAHAARDPARLEELLRTDPESIPTLMLVAALREQAGQASEAAGIYEARILKLNPDFAPAWRQLAFLYAGPLQDEKKAFEAGLKARAVFQTDSGLAKLLGIIAYRRQDYHRAVLLLTESSDNQPQDAELYYSLGMAYHGLRQKDPTKTALKKALALNLEPSLAQQANRVLAELGDPGR